MNSIARWAGRWLLWFILAMLAGFGLVAGARLLIGLPAPTFLPQGGLVGARGPLALQFNEPILAESLTGRLSLVSPGGQAVDGRVEISAVGDTTLARFWPASPLVEGEVYKLALAAGVQSSSGLALRQAQEWPVQVRRVEVVYLSSTEAPDLWAALPDGSAARPLTNTSGRVYDYDVSPDGEWLIYSALNEQQGADLWRVGRAGGQPELLLPCQADLCANPSIAPDGQRMVFSRRQVSGLPGQPAGAPNLWLMNLGDLNLDLLLPDPNVTGYQAAWSPDGRFLAFQDALVEQFYVVDWQARSLAAYPASQNGALTWFAGSDRLFFSRIQGGGDDTRPYVQVFVLNVLTGQEEQVLGEDFGLYDFSLPAESPDGVWLAVGLRRVDGGPGKGLWRMHLDGSQPELISAGDIFANGAYSWDLTGRQLLFQRVELGSSSARPAVWVWAEGSSAPLLVAQDAVLPRWLP